MAVLTDAKKLKQCIPQDFKPVALELKRSTVPDGHERDFDHFEFDPTGSGRIYEQGNSLGVWPHSLATSENRESGVGSCDKDCETNQ